MCRDKTLRTQIKQTKLPAYDINAILWPTNNHLRVALMYSKISISNTLEQKHNHLSVGNYFIKSNKCNYLNLTDINKTYFSSVYDMNT